MTLTAPTLDKQTFIEPFGRAGAGTLPFSAELLAQARERLHNAVLPHTKMEMWKYTSLHDLYERPYQTPSPAKLALPSFLGKDAVVLRFVNGFFQGMEGSIKGAIVADFTQLDEQTALIVEKYVGTLDLQDNSIFTALNNVYARQGLFVYLPANQEAEQLIHIQHLVDSEADIAFNHRNLVVVGENAGVKIVESYHKTSENFSLRNAVTEIYVAKDARLEYVKILDEGDAASHIESTTLVQEANSQTAVFTLTFSGEIVRNNLKFHIRGEHASALLNGATFGSKTQHIDNYTEVHHEVAHCTSSELYKGIVTDKATSVFNGKIQVYQDAQKTAAYQSNRNILLSDTANIYTKPQLEIYADDVKCSHGATTGQLNEDALFYMQARGIAKADARKLLIKAFLAEVIEPISNAELRGYLSDLIHDKLERI